MIPVWMRAILVTSFLLLAACGPRKPPQMPVGSTGQAVVFAPPDDDPPKFTHRDIPVSVHILSGLGPNEVNPTDESDVVGALDFANDTWRDADVQFYAHSVQRHSMRILHRHDDAARRYSWAEVRDDAMQIDPMAGGAYFAPTLRLSTAEWIVQIKARQPRDQITVFVFTYIGHDGASWGSNCASPYPHDDGGGARDNADGRSADGSKGIVCTPGAIAGRRIHALAHEFGHYIGGLLHTFEITNAWAVSTEGYVPADYFDLLYTPNAAGDGVVTFKSRAGALQAGTRLKPLDGNNTAVGKDDSRAVIPNTGCNVQYRLVVPRGTVVLESGQHTDVLAGMAFARKPGSPQLGINVMSYLYEDPVNTPCDMRLAPSQIRMIHKKLGEARGHRNVLGTVQRPRWIPGLRTN
jgi:hypothetical protein